ncbi:aminopeptidase [Melghirimyces algeriensis]|uniref:Aminopeptidase II. Metallo peptidase. MEROPS family M29 n=1 Tax=Melghirimyces algeriensis TaxID=910412 RepID=A0A521ENW3_9BACL|nr:aminopeptidase [Melghirimyces algeriensis]SMO84820.1 aminopeptidase II. Metallo peptidase. MEROPS family M29 [Melghirimyces algeriensis]
MSFSNHLEKYADLAVQTGVNIQPGQTLVITASIDATDLVRSITKKAYQRGAKHVWIEWQDDVCTRLKYDLAPDEAFEEFPLWKAKGYEEIVEKGGAFLHIESNDPELLKGVDPKRIAASSKAAGKALEKWREAVSADQISWCIIAAPSKKWAKKVFPEKNEKDAVEALWKAIFQATRADQENPVEAWKQHNAAIHKKMNVLNQKQYQKLHYRATGTTLTVELPEGHIWSGGSSKNAQGVWFNANIPTEEVFTSPLKTGTQGVVHSTKPLSYKGSLIENFSLTFENGRIVDYHAEKGQETLKRIIELDEGAHYLGEIALVPHDSPISASNITFFNTLFDENASCHLAIGDAFSSCLQGGTHLSKEELEKAGLNHSMTHVDFMIGSADMDIDGETADGKREPIFRKGNWAF